MRRSWPGNALHWMPADGWRFTFVHVLADTVPRARFGDLVRHVRQLVEPGGRLLVSVYGGASEPSAYELLTGLGLAVAGASGTTAWVDA